MLGANEVTALQNGSFRIHSLDIQLEPRSAKFPSFRGPGSIRQNTTGQLIFELYDTNANPTFGRQPGEGAPGGLVPDDHYYRLTALDQGGRRWTADRILPRYSVGGAASAAGAGSVCGGWIPEMSCPEQGTFPQALRLFLPGSFEIPVSHLTEEVKVRSPLGPPRTRLIQPPSEDEREEVGHSSIINVWRLDLANLDITVELSNSGLDIIAAPKGQELPAGLDTRIEETLCFVLAHPCRWLLKMERRGGAGTTCLRSRSTRDFKSDMRPPVDWDYIPSDDVAMLFQRYLAYIQPYSEPRYHPTSVNVLQVLRASAQTVEAEALALAVAIESLLNREYPDCGVPEPELLAEVARLETLISQSNLTDSTKTRALGAVSRLKSANPGSCLRQITKVSSHVTMDLVAAWDKIRKPSAHGREIEVPFEELVNLCDKAYLLFCLLIFNRIGYTGEYKNRTLKGWPEAVFAPFWPPRAVPVTEEQPRS